MLFQVATATDEAHGLRAWTEIHAASGRPNPRNRSRHQNQQQLEGRRQT